MLSLEEEVGEKNLREKGRGLEDQKVRVFIVWRLGGNRRGQMTGRKKERKKVVPENKLKRRGPKRFRYTEGQTLTKNTRKQRTDSQARSSQVRNLLSFRDEVLRLEEDRGISTTLNRLEREVES